MRQVGVEKQEVFVQLNPQQKLKKAEKRYEKQVKRKQYEIQNLEQIVENLKTENGRLIDQMENLNDNPCSNCNHMSLINKQLNNEVKKLNDDIKRLKEQQTMQPLQQNVITSAQNQELVQIQAFNRKAGHESDDQKLDQQRVISADTMGASEARRKIKDLSSIIQQQNGQIESIRKQLNSKQSQMSQLQHKIFQVSRSKRNLQDCATFAAAMALLDEIQFKLDPKCTFSDLQPKQIVDQVVHHIQIPEPVEPTIPTDVYSPPLKSNGQIIPVQCDEIDTSNVQTAETNAKREPKSPAVLTTQRRKAQPKQAKRISVEPDPIYSMQLQLFQDQQSQRDISVGTSALQQSEAAFQTDLPVKIVEKQRGVQQAVAKPDGLNQQITQLVKEIEQKPRNIFLERQQRKLEKIEKELMELSVDNEVDLDDDEQ